METYKDIYEAPAMVYMTGEIAIRIVGSWAYVQTLDGMSIYRYSNADKLWHLHSRQFCTNF